MLTIAILAGGKSKRMGQEKAMMPFQGDALLDRVLKRLERLGGEVIVIGSPSLLKVSPGIRIAPDLIPGRGPLGGLHTALTVASYPAVAVVACDMPFINAELLAHQWDILNSENLDVVVPSWEKGLEPLHALYRQETCLPAVREAMDNGKKRLISWFSKVKVRVLTPEETKTFDPRGLMFMNINTPDELLKAEEQAREGFDSKNEI